ncbi:3-deoxy-manno-octulosonate cytidylyltransferase [Enterococcus faecium]|uniref:3-deoxy-manno-octulosonate cytidylyltransferase n=1 Tax=Enterococcus faecium TaxID=1352 RepID=A0AB73TSF4_ENTFC|nr:3-deoxy-manno-octulosonate cytidylyltransferase [Enterococcus faecium]EGP4707114.1 3-deoxy-manno-octulosonate cytidylyltransferase [Enterococcus faecium]EGP4709912.1 3-deoxy-manno-octulosonate cytidylyltransferase [Enterococcus faecium]EKZ0498558.1 3-deoxy-manno-octulosonate cytidylyltransferase [Enterococcus faecium]EMF0354344.1 3-deoxy-manno-octulosonate cytidylyltransferase [Enterococcus faecium]MBK1310242.1 3-deoxy-manno-octulosonate cytidylyltransferase [Enterococcus faecium]
MKTIAIIPSRYGSSRFPGKPLAMISSKPMIQWVYENVSKAAMLDAVYVATDDKRIFDCVESFGGMALMTSDKHTCGTDRLAECAEILQLRDEDLVLNIQGDEPLIKAEMIADLYSCFDNDEVYMGTLKKHIEVQEELDNPNVVKVINDVNDYAIYFSRFCVPYERDGKNSLHFKHIGVYGYKTWFLKKYSTMPKTPLEVSESLEQLRVLESGFKIRVKETKYQTVGVDTPEQIQQVEDELRKEGL